MSMKFLKKEIFTIPNLLSMFRLLLIPVYMYIYLNATETHHYLIAGSILAVSCLTDMVDGMIARQFNMISQFGKLLDPIADKLTQFALILCLSLKNPPLVPVLILLIGKELFQLVVMVVFLRKGKVLPGALFLGKLCTTVLFITLVAMVLFPHISPELVKVFAVVDFAFLVAALVQYIFAYFGKHKKIEDFEVPQ